MEVMEVFGAYLFLIVGEPEIKVELVVDRLLFFILSSYSSHLARKATSSNTSITLSETCEFS
jgi:hypothetical protein